MNTPRTLLVLAASSVMWACGDDDPSPNDPAPSITAQDQTLQDPGRIRIERVVARSPGFVAITVDPGAGGEGALLGAAAVPRGRTDDLAISLDVEVPQNLRLRATLHLDTGTPGVFEHDDDPALDPPVEDDSGARIEATLDVTIAVTEPVLEASNQTPAELSVLTIDRVDTATAGLIRIVQDVGGTPSFPTIGLALAPVGRQLDVPVAIERDLVDGEQVYALLHEDSNGNGELDWTGEDGSEDPPIEDAGGNPLTAAIVISSTVTPSESILVDRQVTTSSTADIQLDSVVANEAGFVAIYELDASGDLILPALAHDAVSSGLTALLQLDAVPVGSSTTAVELEAVLHRDTDADGVFEWDGGAVDAPALDDANQRIGARFEVSRQVQ